MALFPSIILTLVDVVEVLVVVVVVVVVVVIEASLRFPSFCSLVLP